MKYEKPVWELMGDCALDLPRRFRFNHVRNWFDEHYPNIDDGTLRVHLIGLTETSNNASAFLATKQPLFRRVGHGQYEVIAKSDVEEPAARPASRATSAAARSTPPRSTSGTATKAASKPTRVSVSAAPSARTHVPSSPERVPVSAREEEAVQASVEQEEVEHTRRRPVDELFEPRLDPTRSRASVEPGTVDVVLLGEASAQLDGHAAAKDLFISEDFERSRSYAEATGKPWFVLTSAHGLLAPGDWLSSRRGGLLETSSDYRSAWGVWVVAQLALALGDVAGKSIEILAPSEYVDSVRALLEARGAIVTEPLVGDDLPRTYERPAAERVEPTNDVSDVVADVTALLGNRLAPVPVTSIGTLPDKPGLYSWWVDENGAVDLSDGLGHDIAAGLIYAGQAGATRWPSGTSTSLTLRSRVGQQHLAGSVHDSIFRLSIASILRKPLRLRSLDDPRVSEWMQEHLSVVVCPVEDVDNLRRIKYGVLDQLDPPLNLDGRPSTAVRIMLRDMRRSNQP